MNSNTVFSETFFPYLNEEINKSEVFDCIVLGAGVSGLKCAHLLATENSWGRVLVLEAQDYIGGRVLQNSEFVPGVSVELGAEILHGDETELMKFAIETKQKVEKIYCWAHGDGGPDPVPQDGGYGLYFIGVDTKGSKTNERNRLLRFDDKDGDFVELNNTLWDLAGMDHGKFSTKISLLEYLQTNSVSQQMIQLANAGFANTLCAKIEELSLSQCIRWTKLWEDPTAESKDPSGESTAQSQRLSGDETVKHSGEYRFVDSYSCLIDYLSCKHWNPSEQGPRPYCIRTSSPVASIVSTGGNADSPPTHRLYLKAGGEPYLARTVVCTASPHVLLRPDLLSFHPPLPEEKIEALNSVKMNTAMKVILKFSRLAWPKKLQGMIFAADDCLFPEVWFRDLTHLLSSGGSSDGKDDSEAVEGYCVGFATSDYAAALLQLSEEEMFDSLLRQLDRAFSLLTSRHMSADPDTEADSTACPLPPKPSEVFLGGLVKRWSAETNPYIGGGYCSPKVGAAIKYGAALARPCGPQGSIFFAGEATNDCQPGATAHSALETGIRAANQVRSYLHDNSKVQLL